jgi:hypothetical protein
MQKRQFVMKMTGGQPLTVYRANNCCGGHEHEGAGYLCGSDSEGNGFLIWIEDEDVFLAVEKVLCEQAGRKE